MSPQSIRARLTIWYLAVLGVATLTLAGGSWWLFHQSVIAAADSSLSSRIDGVRGFIDQMERRVEPDEILDEFREYGQLTAGEALLEVTDASGAPLLQAAMPGWDELRVRAADSGTFVFADKAAADRPFRVAVATLVVQGRRYHVMAAISMGPANAALTRFGWLLGLLVPGVVLFAAAGGYAISRRALAPVDRMTRIVQEVSLRNLDRRLEVPAADDELRRLAVTFNDMLARLQAAVADMVRFTTEASHELRTPVSLVRATAEVALSRERSAADYRDALVDVLDQSERMSVLVNDLLAQARADAGVEPEEMAPVDLRALAEAVVRDVRAAVDQRALTLSVDLATPIEVRGTPHSLRRLMLILLDNAIKYTPAGGLVRLRVLRAAESGTSGAATHIEVIDSGIGIDPSERPHIFDRFYRGAMARQHADGSGLGLSIARAIVERHGGAIVVGAGANGHGCRVEVRLP